MHNFFDSFTKLLECISNLDNDKDVVLGHEPLHPDLTEPLGHRGGRSTMEQGFLVESLIGSCFVLVLGFAKSPAFRSTHCIQAVGLKHITVRAGFMLWASFCFVVQFVLSASTSRH